jgi:hypothetical protein
MNDLYAALQVHLHTEPDRRGECHIPCPVCGKESKPKDPHCSFNEQGFYCFVCGASFGLWKLAELVNLDKGDYHAPAAQRVEKPKKTPDWMKNPEQFVRTYENHPRRYELWAAYKPLPVNTIERKRLGVGVFPEYASACRHERLIVPVMLGTMIVGLRGRSINCDCGKWLSASGSVDLPLYNSDELRYGDIIFIVENPVDALMVCSQSVTGVATYGVTMWHDEWTKLLIDAKPRKIYVAYDNDLPGNGGAKNRWRMATKWLETHPRIPEANGVRLVNNLLDAGLPAKLYDWGDAPEKYDIGSLVIENMKNNA